MEDLAFAGQKIIFDSQAQHGLKMPAQHRGRKQIGNFRRLVAPSLNGVQGFQTDILPLLLLRIRRLVPLRNPRIKVPAVIVNALPLALRSASNCLTPARS